LIKRASTEVIKSASHDEDSNGIGLSEYSEMRNWIAETLVRGWEEFLDVGCVKVV
jgi:hypothetical protein